MNRIVKTILAAFAATWAGYTTAGPITDTVLVRNTEWAQTDLFAGLSWNDINAVCPAGLCGNGTLNGFDMAGWTWADTDAMNNLFNHYIGFATLGPGPDTHSSEIVMFSDLFFADGWRADSNQLGRITYGYNADSPQYWSEMFAFRNASGVCNGTGICRPEFDRASTEADFDFSLFFPGTPSPGAWFVRPATEVPGPATLPLLGLALAVLGYRRKSGVK